MADFAGGARCGVMVVRGAPPRGTIADGQFRGRWRCAGVVVTMRVLALGLRGCLRRHARVVVVPVAIRLAGGGRSAECAAVVVRLWWFLLVPVWLTQGL